MEEGTTLNTNLTPEEEKDRQAKIEDLNRRLIQEDKKKKSSWMGFIWGCYWY